MPRESIAMYVGIQRLRERHGLSVRTARCLVQNFGTMTAPEQWISDLSRIRSLAGIGKVARKEIMTAINNSDVGLDFHVDSVLNRCSLPSPPPKKKSFRLARARRAIEKTVRRMGGKIEWTVSEEETCKKRALRRKRVVAKWRAKKAIQELNRIAQQAANENRVMNPMEAKHFDKLMSQAKA